MLVRRFAGRNEDNRCLSTSGEIWRRRNGEAWGVDNIERGGKRFKAK